MLLMTLDINGTTRRVSNEELALDHSWFAELVSAPTVKRASQQLYGGYFAPTFGGFTTTPETFTGTTWPPPKKISATVQRTGTTEAAAVTYLDGIAHRKSFDRNGVTFDLKKPDYDVSIQTTVTGNLTDIFATYCGVSYLNRMIDTSGTARNPAVVYEVTSETQVIDVLSSIAAFFSHAFYDDGTTIYLYDCLADNGSLSIGEFDFAPATYQDSPAISEFKAGDYTVSGSYPHGIEYSVSPVCHDTQANIEAALADIKTIMEMPGATLTLPLPYADGITPGMKLYWTDESQGSTVTAWMRVQSILCDFNAYTVQVIGKGGVA